MKAICGCGETRGLRHIVMSDKLWDDFFSTPDAIRPPSVHVCRTCIVDMERYAAPLYEIPREAALWITQGTFPVVPVQPDRTLTDAQALDDIMRLLPHGIDSDRIAAIIRMTGRTA